MIFLSYCWSESDYADRVEEYLLEKNFEVIRDKSALKKTDSISDFMDRVKESDHVILLISASYLASYNCLYEAFAAYEGKSRENMIPVVFPDAHLFDTEKQKEWICFWNRKKAQLEESCADVDPVCRIDISKRIRQVEYISNYLGDLMAYLSSRNCIRTDGDERALEEVYTCLCDKILSREIRSGKVPVNASILLPDEIRVCIDFGTSYTLVSVVDLYGNRHLIPALDGRKMVRSSVEWKEDGTYLVGSSHADALTNMKRLIGAKEYLKFGREKMDIRLLIAMILKSVLRNAGEYLNVEISEVLMAIPADFDLFQKKILRESAALAGVRVYRFVPEPSAEAFLMEQKKDGYFAAIIDLGGGTLDLSLVEVFYGIYETVYIDGDDRFGSIDFDHAVAAYLTDKVGNRVSCEKEALFRQMLQYSEHIKCQMSSQETVHLSFEIDSDNGDICMMPFSVTRKEFESVTKGLTKKFKSKLERLKKAYEEISELYENEPLVIYLTGQGTKLSILKELIYKVFPGVPVNSDYQESALIQGLSEQSRCLWANRKMDKNVDGLLLNLSYISLVLKCQRYDEEEHAAILSRAGNHNDLVFLEQETVPCKSSVKLMFTDLTGLEETEEYDVILQQKKQDGSRQLLKCLKVKLQRGKDYILEFDEDANLDVMISLYEETKGSWHSRKLLIRELF